MGKGYWVTMYQAVRDPAKMAEYAALAGPAITAGGGRFLVRNTSARTFEGKPELRTIVIVFDTVAQAIATYESAEYQAAKAKLGDSVDRDVRIVEGAP
jgi:uncharacterized protein (DUF1330 family)